MPSFSHFTNLRVASLNGFLRLTMGVTRGAAPPEPAGARATQPGPARWHTETSARRAGGAGGQKGRRPKYDEIMEDNQRALEQRPYLNPDYRFRPVSTHEKDFQALKKQHPYFGYVNAEVEGVPPFVMFSANDDRVAQTYFWYGPDAFESLSLRLWRELARRSRFVFDVGAFTGVYSLTAARANREAQVYAFEPVRRVFGRLADNLKANGLGRRVRAFDLALGDTDGPTTMNLFYGQSFLSSGSSLVPKGGKEILSREHVEGRRLDTFVEEQDVGGADLVKVDVEQAEELVVGGMPRTLQRHRPHLLVEVLSAENLKELDALLKPHGYSFAVIEDLTQSFYVNDFGAQKGVRNVLFGPVPAGDLRDFCSSIKPLPR